MIAGTIGHVAHGKSTIVKAISGVQTVRFKNELERNITIKLGEYTKFCVIIWFDFYNISKKCRINACIVAFLKTKVANLCNKMHFYIWIEP